MNDFNAFEMFPIQAPTAADRDWPADKIEAWGLRHSALPGQLICASPQRADHNTPANHSPHKRWAPSFGRLLWFWLIFMLQQNNHLPCTNLLHLLSSTHLFLTFCSLYCLRITSVSICCIAYPRVTFLFYCQRQLRPGYTVVWSCEANKTASLASNLLPTLYLVDREVLNSRESTLPQEQQIQSCQTHHAVARLPCSRPGDRVHSR